MSATGKGWSRRGLWAPLLLVTLALGACGSSTASPGASPTATPAPTATPTSSAPSPPSAQVTTAGTGGLAGALTIKSVNCALPTVDGPEILLFAVAQAPDVSVRLDVLAGKVTVTADSGAGAQFKARSFTGPGVTGFYATRGAQLSGSLTETGSGSPPGSIGTVTSVSGTVSCNNQQPGSSTVTLTGATDIGALSGSISSANVKCNGSIGALTLGLVTIGGTSVLVDLFGGSPNGTSTVSLVLAPKGGSQQHYAASGATVATVTATGVTFNADAVEDNPPGGAHTVHISGDVVCGSSVVP